MKGSIIISCFFAAGILLGLFTQVPESFLQKDSSLYALYLLTFLVGISIGGDPRLPEIIRSLNFRILVVPLFVILGTLAGAGIYILCFNTLSKQDTIAISFGFGYYSLSSVLIGELSGNAAGVIALLSNLIREISTLLLVPLMVRYFGPLAPVMSGGATTMDTTLPVIMKYAGKDYSIIGLISGIILSFMVPFLISLVYSF
jgi:uncharacterized membrane protein YbjE (DUF340 family)